MKNNFYICNGQKFKTVEQLNHYCTGAGLRITRLCTIGRAIIAEVTSVEPIKVFEPLNVTL